MKLRLTKPKLTEKRSSVRLNIEIPVTYCEMRRKFWPFKRRGVLKEGLVRKPSMYGLRLCGNDAFTEGQKFEINAQLNQVGLGEACTIRGLIVWTRFNPKTGKYEAGMELFDTGKGMILWKRAVIAKLRTLDN